MFAELYFFASDTSFFAYDAFLTRELFNAATFVRAASFYSCSLRCRTSCLATEAAELCDQSSKMASGSSSASSAMQRSSFSHTCAHFAEQTEVCSHVCAVGQLPCLAQGCALLLSKGDSWALFAWPC